MPHTPGPWTVHDLWNNNPCVENGGVFEVEEAHYDVKEGLEAGCDVEGVIKGNARLIAQAPAMYELLKTISDRSVFPVSSGGVVSQCLFCGAIGRDHSPDCQLAAVLNAVEGECQTPNTTA
jgi:hypothetical protein